MFFFQTPLQIQKCHRWTCLKRAQYWRLVVVGVAVRLLAVLQRTRRWWMRLLAACSQTEPIPSI